MPKNKKCIIRKVLWKKSANTKYVIIPKDEKDILPGDYVKVEKVNL